VISGFVIRTAEGFQAGEKTRSALYGFYPQYGIVGGCESLLFFAALPVAQRQALAALFVSMPLNRTENPPMTCFGRRFGKFYRWHRLCSDSCIVSMLFYVVSMLFLSVRRFVTLYRNPPPPC